MLMHDSRVALPHKHLCVSIVYTLYTVLYDRYYYYIVHYSIGEILCAILYKNNK